MGLQDLRGGQARIRKGFQRMVAPTCGKGEAYPRGEGAHRARGGVGCPGGWKVTEMVQSLSEVWWTGVRQGAEESGSPLVVPAGDTVVDLLYALPL